MTHIPAPAYPPPPPYAPPAPRYRAPAPRPVVSISPGWIVALAGVLLGMYVILFVAPRYGAWTACGARSGQAVVLAAGFESPSLTECTIMKWGVGTT